MYYFRADANEEIGAGHMMRCITIAQALAEETVALTVRAEGMPEATDAAPVEVSADKHIVFLCADERSASLPRQAGFAVQILGTEYTQMEEELPALSVLFARDTGKVRDDGASGGGETLAGRPSPAGGYYAPAHHPLENERPTIVVDSYFVTDAYLAVLRAFCRVVLMDDNMERAYPADVIINYNFHADADAYRALYAYGDADAQLPETHTAVISGTRLCTGPSYAPVRAQFANRDFQVREHVERILVLSGGSDPDNAAGAVYRALRGGADMSQAEGRPAPRGGGADIPQAGQHPAAHDSTADKAAAAPEIVIVRGRYNPHRETLAAYEKKDARLRVLCDVDDMASLMCECDLAITACGSTVYELCAVGVPFVCYALADNQLELAAYLDVNGPAPYAGAFHKHPAAALSGIAAQVNRLGRDFDARRALSRDGRRLVDGQGAARIARRILYHIRSTSSGSGRVSVSG